MLANIEGACNCRVDGHVLYTARAWCLEVGGEVVEELADQVIRVCQIHEQIVRLWQQVVRKVGHHEHLGLLQGCPKIEVVQVFIVRQEANSCTLTAWQSAFL